MESFGRHLLNCRSLNEALTLEDRHGRSQQFEQIDEIVAALAIRSLRGERIMSMTEDSIRRGKVKIHHLSTAQHNYLAQTFDVARQREGGMWTVPEKIRVEVGKLDIGHHFEEQPSFPLAAASAESCRVESITSPEAVFLWSVFNPFMATLLQPIELRSSLTGTHSPEELSEVWKEIDAFYSWIGVTPLEELEIFRPGRGWGKLTSRFTQHAAKKSLLKAFAAKISSATVRAYRLRVLRPLVEQYYKKAKSAGIAKRKQVVTKPFLPMLSGYFGGDWLTFVEYLGEKPHPDEQIIVAMPSPRMFVGGVEKVSKIAEAQNLPSDEVAKVAAALWPQSRGASPIEQRVACLKNYWEVVGAIHDRQKPGMKPLWGLVDDIGRINFEPQERFGFHPRLYLELLPSDLLQDVDRLWGTTFLSKHPEIIVSEPFPHFAMAKAFGPALSFWHSCALTAWFICEGPSSRTDLRGLAHRERHSLAKLQDLDVPVGGALFEELINAEKNLGPEQDIESEQSVKFIEPGIRISIGTRRTRRDGFEILRDIISRHRSDWARKYLDVYLKQLWQKEISRSSTTFFLKMSEKGGKPPTLKQFVPTAADPARNWFGGDISSLYTAIGERSPCSTRRHQLLPGDSFVFAKRVATLLRPRNFDCVGQPAEEHIQRRDIEALASKAIDVVQLYEAVGEMPELSDFSTNFKYHHAVLHEDINKAWEIYTGVIANAIKMGDRTTLPIADRTQDDR